MYRVPLFLLVLLSACTESVLPPAEDGGLVALADAGELEPDSATADLDARLIVEASTRVDAEASDAGSSEPDAGSPGPDSGPPEPDAGIDSGSPEPDAGSPDAGNPDAGSPDAGSPDAGGCAADALELNDAPADAVLVASGTGWAPSAYPLTWSPGDSADWVRADLDSTGVVGLFRVHAVSSDSRSMVEVRVTCPSGVAVCRGSSAALVGGACVGRRMFNAYVDAACNSLTPSAVDVLVGVERGARACDHELRVHLAAAP